MAFCSLSLLFLLLSFSLSFQLPASSFQLFRFSFSLSTLAFFNTKHAFCLSFGPFLRILNHDTKHTTVYTQCCLHSYSDWDPKSITDTLNQLIPSKAMLCISSKTLAHKCNTTEPWFKTKYNVEAVDPAWEAEFAAIGTTSSPLTSELHLPPPNVLIASDFSLLPAPDAEPSAPTLVDQQLTHAVWHQPDATFRMPRCNVYIKFVSPKVFESPEATVLYDLFISVLTMNLKEYAYAARLAELDYTFWAQRGGFCLRVHGFNEKVRITS